MHLVNWAMVCKDQRSVGLGTRKLDPLNMLLGKWLWRYAHEHNSLKRKIIY